MNDNDLWTSNEKFSLSFEFPGKMFMATNVRDNNKNVS